MKKKLIAFTINTIKEADSIILVSKTYKIKPILHFKKYFLLGFGAGFILTFQEILISKFGNSSFKLFVDCGFDQSLAIRMATKKINYLKLKSNSVILSKVNNIANNGYQRWQNFPVQSIQFLAGATYKFDF